MKDVGLTRQGLGEVSIVMYKGNGHIPMRSQTYVPFSATSLVPMVGCRAVSVLVNLVPGSMVAFVPYMTSNLASTAGVKPTGVWADTRPANRVATRADAVVKSMVSFQVCVSGEGEPVKGNKVRLLGVIIHHHK